MNISPNVTASWMKLDPTTLEVRAEIQRRWKSGEKLINIAVECEVSLDTVLAVGRRYSLCRWPSEAQ